MNLFGRAAIGLAAVLVGLAATWAGYVWILDSDEKVPCADFTSDEGVFMQPEYAELQSVLERASAKYDGIGLQATVIFADGTQWSEAAGYADLKRRCPLTMSHHLYIGSMTKLFTAALILDQVEDGRFALDDPLGGWFDDAAGREVSVRQLLNHTSGIPNYTVNPWFAARYIMLAGKRWQPDELYPVFAHRPLMYSPGSRHLYSNSNYVLLGMVLEKISGFTYPRLLREQILEPLGLVNTYCLDRPNGLLVAKGYDESLLKLGRLNATGLRTSLESGAYSAGCVLSTSRNVAKFTRALFGGKVVGANSLAEMTTFVSAPDEDIPLQTAYGLGVRRLKVDGEVFIGHTGSIPGYSGLAMFHPATGITIVILSNLSSIDSVGVLQELWGAIEE